MKKKLIAIKVPPTPHTEYLNGEYRAKLLELLEAHGFKNISTFRFTSLEAIAFNHKLICMVWSKP